MKFENLGKSGGSRVAKQAAPSTIVMRLDRVAIEQGKPSFFHGFDARTGEAVVVRMNTVEEGMLVAGKAAIAEPEATKQKLRDQYMGNGEKRRPRPSEFADENNKVYCAKNGLLAFTRCLPNEDGSFRAHWAETLERHPGTGCDFVTANIRLEAVKDGANKRFTAVADVVNPDAAVILNKDNCAEALYAAFATEGEVNGQQIPRKPFAYFRLVEAATGAMPLPPSRIGAALREVKEIDHDAGGVEVTRYLIDSAEASIMKLMTPAKEALQSDLAARAMVFGLGDEPGYPDWTGHEKFAADLNQIVDVVRSGDYVVELVPGERINAGPAARASLVKVGFDPKTGEARKSHPAHMFYSPRDDRGYVSARHFLPTYLTTEIGKDGYRFFTKFMAADNFPQKTTMQRLATVNDHKATAEAAKARVAENETVDPDDVPFDPTALDAGAAQEADSKLASAAAALDEAY